MNASPQSERSEIMSCSTRSVFKTLAPNRLWVSDFTCVAMWSGVAYVAFAIDVLSRRIVGWKADTTMKTSLVLDAAGDGALGP